MNVEKTVVTNTANLSLFMVNVAQLLLSEFRQTDPDFSVLNLKAFLSWLQIYHRIDKNASAKTRSYFYCPAFSENLHPGQYSWLKIDRFLSIIGEGID